MTDRFIGLLRGINVGGNKKIPMADLRKLLGELGFSNVKTVLASGNVAWDGPHQDIPTLRAQIEADIQTTFGFQVDVLIVPHSQIEHLIASDPFAGITVTEDTRLYVSFLPNPTPTKLTIPYTAPDGDFTILRVTDTEVCSVLTLTTTPTKDAMSILEGEFGKHITTRNWNTVLKLATL